MISEEKIKSIHRDLRRGIPEGEIKNTLLSEGYSHEDIAGSFKPNKPDMRSWYLISAIIFLIVGIFRALQSNSFLLLIFSGVMFYQYYRADIKFKKEKQVE